MNLSISIYLHISQQISTNLNLSQHISTYIKEAPMPEVKEYDLPGVKTYDLRILPDERGFFSKAFKKRLERASWRGRDSPDQCIL